MLVVGIKDLYSSEFQLFRLDQYNKKGDGIWTDEKLVKKAVSELRKYHVLIGHFFMGFDVKFLRGRCLEYGIDPIDPRTFCIDTCSEIRRYAKISRYKLEAFAKALGIDPFEVANEIGVDPKVIEIDQHMWKRGLQLDKAGMDFISDHCKLDLAVNEKAYWKFIDPRGVRSLRRIW